MKGSLRTVINGLVVNLEKLLDLPFQCLQIFMFEYINSDDGNFIILF